MRRQQAGFTLIEIVAVIVLLGILAVTAIPRFVNLQSDAKIAALKGVAAAVQGAYTQAYAKALIQGNVAAADQTVDMGAGINDVEISFGYPEAIAEADGSIITMLNLDSAFSTETDAGAGPGGEDVVYIGYDADGAGGTALSAQGCYIIYIEAAAAGDTPDIDDSNTGSC